MPKLQQYVSQEASRGRALNSTRVTPQGLDIGGALRGVADAANAATQLAEVQQREAQKLAIDEAKIGVERTMSEGAAMWTERVASMQNKAPKDAAGFTDGLLREFDAWSIEQTGANQDPNGKKLLEHNLLQMRQHLHAQAFSFEVKQRKAALVDDFSQGVDAELSAVLVDPSQWAGAVARKRALAQSLDLAPDIREKLERDTVERLSKAAADGIINQSGGAEAFLAMAGARASKGPRGREGISAPDAAERVASNPILSGMSAKDFQASLDRASMLVSQHEAARDAAALRAAAESERRLKHAEAEFNVFQAMSDKGTALAPGYIDKAMAATAGTPYQEGIRQLAQQAKESGGFARMPVAQQVQALREVDAQIAQNGRSPALDKRREALEKVVKGSEADLKADALTAGLQRGVITDFKPIQFGGGLDALVPQIQQRAQQASAVGQWAGRPVSPFTSDETRELFTRISAQPAAQRSQTLAALATSMPPDQALALAAQLDGQSKSDQNRAYAAALQAGADRTTQGRYTSEIILKGAAALQDKTIKEERQAVEGWRPKIASALNGVYGNEVQRAAIADKARFILAGKVSENGYSWQDAIEEAVVLATGGPIIERNKAKIVIPAGMDDSQFDAKIKKLAPDSLRLKDGSAADVAGGVYVHTGAGRTRMDAAEFMKAIPAAQLQFVDLNGGKARYLVRAGTAYASDAKNQALLIEVTP